MEALTYERVREELEPLDGYERVALHHSAHPTFEIADGGGINVAFPRDPTDGDTEVDRYVVTRELWDGLAKDLGAGSRYFDQTPPRLLLPNLNYWYGERDAGKPAVDLLVRTQPDGSRFGLDILKPGKHPVRGTQLLEVVHGTVADLGGEPSYSFYEREGLKEVTLACIQPQVRHEVRSRQVGDVLEAGVLVRFSPIGAIPVTVQAFTNRLICTNGMVTTSTLDAWSAPGGEGSNDPYEWLPEAIGMAWHGNESMFAAADRMAATEVPEDAIETVVTDIFDFYRTPAGLRAAVLRQLANQNVETMWDLQNAITFAATHDEALKQSRQRVRLMALGGDLPAHSERCEACSHLLN